MFVLMLVMVVGVVPFDWVVDVNAASSTAIVVTQERGGYVLVPELFGTTGVDVGSSFLLTTPVDIPVGAGLPVVSIDGERLPYVTRESANTFWVTPVAPFSHNSLYIFRLERDSLPDITWAFQTTIRFQITSTLPADETVNVPVDTGIEFTFSSAAHTPIDDYFSIYPHVAGRFITRGTTTVFMPTSRLAYQQLYTVTLRAGVRLNGTNEAITADRVFTFETAARPVPVERPARQPVRIPDRIHFFRTYAEFPSFASPEIHFVANRGTEFTDASVVIDVYMLENNEDAVYAVRKFLNTPRWSRYAWRDSLIDTTELTHVFTLEPEETDYGFETARLLENLPNGFYLVSATFGDAHDQMIIQITDLAVQIVADDTALIWVNDMTTGLPAVGARIYDAVTSRFYETDEDGIAIIERGMMRTFANWLAITAEDGKEGFVFLSTVDGHFAPAWNRWTLPDGGHTWGGASPAADQYWRVFQVDRTLFQRSDTVNLWGFVQNRGIHEEISYVTATLRSNRGNDILHQQNIPVENGVFSGEIQLPHLDPGAYTIAITHRNITIGSISISVQDFVKPPYQLTAVADRRAMFVDEMITFSANAAFFEGTPVAELEVTYSFSGSPLRVSSGSNRGRTDINGNIEASTGEFNPSSNTQGQHILTFTANATLPEIGRVQRSATTRVFINDIDMRVSSRRTDGDAWISVNINDITLDRINDGTARNQNDFRCAPTAGQEVQVEITRIYWERTRSGEFYCFIERRVIPRYTSRRRTEVIETFTMTTDANGEARQYFQVPNRPHESYQASVTTIDGNGRVISRGSFIGRDFTSFHQSASGSEFMFMYGARSWSEGYDIGEEVTVSIYRGAEKVTQGNLLFVVAQQGILHYHVGSNPFTFDFEDKYVPNAVVFAFHFNGHTYYTSSRMSQRLRFNSESRNLNLNITTCQSQYRPGETATITIVATDNYGNPKQSNINISLVDEALFALRNYEVDTLTTLYRQIATRLRFSMSTHRAFVSDGIPELNQLGQLVLRQSMPPMRAADGSMAGAVSPPAMSPGAAMDMAESASGGGDDTHLREVFEDTAVFAALRTNERGVATFTFRLPDNITSWRLTASGISDDLYAGNYVGNVMVTNPMFLHYSLNDIFLVGDTPTIGVNVFGTSLTGTERVFIDVYPEGSPEDMRRIQGAPFERINIPLWEMTEEGPHAVIIRATTDTGLSDAVRHGFEVVNSHRHIDTAVFYDVTADTEFAIGLAGLTNITFTDHGRGQFLRDLSGMRHMRSTNRVEALVIRREATKLINEHFPDTWFTGRACNFNPRDYQRQDGGMAMLTYAESDLALTIRLMPFILDEINVPALRNYLNRALTSDNADNKMQALYGLAMLQEPVLLDLQNYLLVENLSMRDTAYIALSFVALGEIEVATAIYNERILPNIQSVPPFYRVYTGTRYADILDATAVVALLASQINAPQREGLHQYVARRRACGFLANLERLTFIAQEIENYNPERASITYTLFGRSFTRDLSHGRSYTLRIPTQNKHEFNLVSVTGDVGAVSIHRTPLEDIETIDNNITIRREFFRAGTSQPITNFYQDEIITVRITVTNPATSVGGSYVITDFLPAGLVFLHGSRASSEGQRVTFHSSLIGPPRDPYTTTFSYTARVINPGIFTAEGTIVQNMGVREYLTIGAPETITIRG